MTQIYADLRGYFRGPAAAFIPAIISLALFLSSCGGKSETARTEGAFVSPGESVKSFGIDISEDGSKLYLADNTKQMLVVMNAATVKTSATYPLGQRPRMLEIIPDKDWLLLSFEKYDCTGSGSPDCMKLAAFDTTENKIDFEAEIVGGTVSSPRTFAYAANGKVYIANGECRWDANGKTDLGALYVADLSGPEGATAPIELVSGVSYKSYFGTAIWEDEDVLFLSRSCCTDVCTTDDKTQCTNEETCAGTCDDLFADGSTEEKDCYQSCKDENSCRRNTTCTDPNYSYTCGKKCGSKNAGDCVTIDSKLYYFDTITDAEFSDSPIDISGCNGAGYMVFDDSRDSLYISCTDSMSITGVQFISQARVMQARLLPPITVGTASARTAGSGVNLGSVISNLTMSADNKYLFISHQWFNAVSMVDLDTWELLKVFETGEYPADIAERYPYIYVTNVLGGSVTKINYVTAESARVAVPILPDFR